MKEKLPSISVCIPTYNSASLVERTLKDVRSQDYPQSKIEIILADGGSTDNTEKLAQKYNAKFIKVPPEKQHAEYNRGVAFNKAKNELALIIDHDNYLPSKNWLKRLVLPLLDDQEIVASTTQYYHYNKKYKLMDRYFALYGSSEPLPYFLKKADRSKQTDDKIHFNAKKITEHKDYFVVNFYKKAHWFPAIGSNGTLMRRKLILDIAQADADHHYPIDVLVDVVLKGHTKFAIVKNSIIHLTHSKGLVDFIKRRKKFVEQYHFEENSKRRWSVVMQDDYFAVFLYVIYSLSIILPTVDSLKGYIKKPDIAWFVHLPMCLATTAIYGFVTIKHILQSVKL